MAKLLYQFNSYMKTARAVVTDIDGTAAYFDATIFHPKSGGVDNDIGLIRSLSSGAEARVVNVLIDKARDDVLHVLDRQAFAKGEEVEMIIDWERRYRLMRLHTAAHIISAIMYTKFNALVTGGNISPEYGYDDYGLEALDKSAIQEVIDEANGVAKRDLEVRIYWLKREEALAIPGIVKLANRLPPQVDVLRIVEIPGVDIQADGGPHVSRTGEIGEIALLKFENKGKNKKRIYFTARP